MFLDKKQALEKRDLSLCMKIHTQRNNKVYIYLFLIFSLSLFYPNNNYGKNKKKYKWWQTFFV
jgi:hypothetical protein